MPYTVNSSFEAFNKDTVNLDSNQVPIARTSRDALIRSMHLLSNRGLLPPSYGEKDIPYGSFARRTKIRPLDDIDLMICFKGSGGSWYRLEDDRTIAISMPDTAPVLSELRNDDSTLNSRKLIELIKSQLSNVQYYKKAGLHRNKEAATLQLTSYVWNFDIVPCFYTTDNFYLIPDGNGNWKKTDPRIDQARVTEENQANDGKLLQLIRTMKYWKNMYWTNVSSYMFEQMVINSSHYICFEQPFAYTIRAVLNSLSSMILGSVADPKNMQGDLNILDSGTRRQLSDIASKHSGIAQNAILQEHLFSNHSEAIESWKSIFGSEFPLYGKG